MPGRYWALVVITGALAGLGAVALELLLKAVERLAWPDAGGFLESARAATPQHRVLAVTAAGALVVAVSLLLRRPLGGQGTGHLLEAIWLNAGKLPLVGSLGRSLVSIVAVGLGISLGREGALIQTGAATASFLGRKLGVSEAQSRMLVACGASAGIAAAYNAPVGAALFGLEVLLGAFELELLGPIVVACAVSTEVARGLAGSQPVYAIPNYQLLDARELALASAMALVGGLASALFVKALDATSRVGQRQPRGVMMVLPLAGALAVGLLAIPFPEILGNGFDATNEALHGKVPLAMLLALPLVKLLATSLSAGSGIPGGLFTPSLMFGAMLGAAFGEVAGVAPTGAWALLGMAATLAGTTQAAASAAVFVFELTGDYQMIVPMMLVSVLSAGVARAVEPLSLYTSSLSRRKIVLPEMPRPDWLRVTEVRALGWRSAETVSPIAPFREVVARLLSSPGNDLYVVTPDGRFEGVVTLEDVKRHIPDEPNLGMVVAADLMERGLHPLRPESSLAEAARRFADTALDTLPVVDGETGRLLGVLDQLRLLQRGRF